MHGHVSKCVKTHIKPTGSTDKHGKYIITQSEKREGMQDATDIIAMHPKMVTTKQGLMGVGCNHPTINPLRVSNVAKPKSREANMSIKHRSKQAWT